MIYFIQDINRTGPIKIGFTGLDDVATRLTSLQIGHPSKLVVLATMPGDRIDEAILHRHFSRSRMHGEWFAPTQELTDLIFSSEGVGLLMPVPLSLKNRVAQAAISLGNALRKGTAAEQDRAQARMVTVSIDASKEWEPMVSEQERGAANNG